MGKGKEMITLTELKEKAVSKQQQKLMGLALAYKRGEVEDSKVSDTVKDLAKSMSTKELEDFASTKHKGLPQKKEDNNISNRSAALKPQTYDDPTTGRKKVRMVPSKSNIVKTNDRVDEAKDPGEYDNEGEMAKTQLKSILRDAEHMIEMFDDEENLPEWVQNKITKAQDYLQSAHSYMMGQDDDGEEVKEYLEVGTDAIRKNYASMTPGQTNELTGTDKALAVGAVGALAYGAKKARDRFDPVKVAKARRDRAEKKKERSEAERELAQTKRDHINYQKKLRDMRDRQNKQRNKR